MSDNWAFATLNELSPLFASPENGPADATLRDPFSLSYPIDSAALANSLEQWNSLPFDSNQPFFTQSDFYDLPLLAVTPADITTVPTATALTTAAPTIATTTTATTKSTKKRSRANAIASTSALDDAPAATTASTDDSLNAAAIEEDKRKRNTAASARFRIKKKQREAALETTAKDLQDKVAALEGQVTALRTENGWLRGLIVDQTTKKESEARAVALDSTIALNTVGAIDPSLLV